MYFTNVKTLGLALLLNLFPFMDTSDFHSNEWVVQIDGPPSTAERLARDTGYIYKGQVIIKVQ